MKHGFIALVLALSACSNQPDARFVNGSEWLAEKTPGERAAFYTAHCIQQGFEPRTTEFANCVYETSNQYELGKLQAGYQAQFLD